MGKEERPEIARVTLRSIVQKLDTDALFQTVGFVGRGEGTSPLTAVPRCPAEGPADGHISYLLST